MTPTTSGWRTQRLLVTKSTDPEGKALVATDVVTYAGDHLMVPAVDEAATEMRDARAHLFALIDAGAAVSGDEVARDLEDAAIDVEVAIRIEVIARLLGVATALEPGYGMFILKPGTAAPVECPPPLPEWQFDRMVRWRGRRVLTALAGAFAAGLALRALVGAGVSVRVPPVPFLSVPRRTHA